MATIKIRSAEEILNNLTKRGFITDRNNEWAIDPNGPQAFHVSMLKYCGKRIRIKEPIRAYFADQYDYTCVNGYGWDREWVDKR